MRLMLRLLPIVALAVLAGCQACADGTAPAWGGYAYGTTYTACPSNAFQKYCCSGDNLKEYGCRCSAACPCWKRHN